jgi:hypothetical protein
MGEGKDKFIKDKKVQLLHLMKPNSSLKQACTSVNLGTHYPWSSLRSCSMVEKDKKYYKNDQSSAASISKAQHFFENSVFRCEVYTP